MTAEWWALLLTAAGLVGGIVWGAAKVSATGEKHDDALAKIAAALEKLADAVAIESRSNAVQDERLDSQEKRLDGHDDRLNRMERGR